MAETSCSLLNLRLAELTRILKNLRDSREARISDAPWMEINSIPYAGISIYPISGKMLASRFDCRFFHAAETS